MDTIEWLVFLDDGETYSGLDGARIVGIRKSNWEEAEEALANEDYDRAFELAEVITPVPIPQGVAERIDPQG